MPLVDIVIGFILPGAAIIVMLALAALLKRWEDEQD